MATDNTAVRGGMWPNFKIIPDFMDALVTVIMGKMIQHFVTSLFFIGSSSFLQVTSASIKSGMSLKFGHIPPRTAVFNFQSDPTTDYVVSCL